MQPEHDRVESLREMCGHLINELNVDLSGAVHDIVEYCDRLRQETVDAQGLSAALDELRRELSDLYEDMPGNPQEMGSSLQSLHTQAQMLHNSVAMAYERIQQEPALAQSAIAYGYYELMQKLTEFQAALLPQMQMY